MIKKYKGMMIFTSVITLLPVLAGLLLWNRLPDKVATHFGADNMPDSFSSKAFAVFGLPLVILALHWVCMLITSADPKSKNIGDKNMNMVLWICPAVSLLVNSLVYAYALNNELRIGFIVILFMGILFMVMGNYMPKSRQNHTFGMKLPWTLEDTENWNRTHRFAGKLWMLCGAVACATAVFENPFVFLAIVTLAGVVPTVYSYVIYKKSN